MLESKYRVAKETVRKETARAAIALAREEIRAERAERQGPGEARPSASQGPALQTADDSALYGIAGSEFRSPRLMHKATRESHHTWQRGAKVVSQSSCFPVLECPEESPLMYDMLRLHSGAPKQQSARATDTIPESCSSSVSSLNTIGMI